MKYFLSDGEVVCLRLTGLKISRRKKICPIKLFFIKKNKKNPKKLMSVFSSDWVSQHKLRCRSISSPELFLVLNVGPLNLMNDPFPVRKKNHEKSREIIKLMVFCMMAL